MRKNAVSWAFGVKTADLILSGFLSKLYYCMSAWNKYPKLLLFLVTVIVVYFLFSGLLYEPLHNALLYLGYFGTFLAGLLYPYSFTSAAGTAMLLILAKDQSVLLAGIIASVGALISDLVIFFFVKYSFTDEVQRLSNEKIIQKLCKWIPCSLRRYLLLIFASVVIASPLPTEIGVVLMCSVKSMSAKRFAVIVYILHAIAISVILLIGNSI